MKPTEPKLDAVQTAVLIVILALVGIPLLGVWWKLCVYIWRWALGG